FSFGRASAELVRKRFACRRELQANGVYAVTLACRRRAVGKDVALVRTASGANDLRANHAVARVADVLEMALAKWRGEARPACPALELRSSIEQGQAAQAAGEDAGSFLIQEHAAEGRFRSVLQKYMALLIAEIGLKLTALVLSWGSEIEVNGGGFHVCSFESPGGPIAAFA